MRVLQDALRNVTSEMDFVPLELITEAMVPSARPIDTAQFQAQPLFIWYDYFSCPQLGRPMHELANAIDSIPAYVARASFFFALCPVISSPVQSKVFTVHTWAQRAWCLVEKACQELSLDASWILIRSPTKLEVISTQAASVGGSPGEGDFTYAADREKLGPVLLRAVERRLYLYLKKQDLVGYRVLLNMQPVHLRGFDVEPLKDLIPGFEASNPDLDATSFRVGKFLFQNGFSSVGDKDSLPFSFSSPTALKP